MGNTECNGSSSKTSLTTYKEREKKFIEEQRIQFIIAVSIILLSLILKPGTSEDDRATIFGFKTPILCLHRLIYNEPCAGCGLTRSFVSTAHGDLESAYSYHKLGIPLFILVVFQIPIRVYLLKTGIKGYTSLVKKLITVPAILAGIALIVHWLIFSYLSHFPSGFPL